MESNTAKILRIVSSSKLYRHWEFGGNPLWALLQHPNHAVCFSVWEKIKVPSPTTEDVRRALSDLNEYQTMLGGDPKDSIFETFIKLYGFTADADVNEKKVMRPLFLDWDNRPLDLSGVRTYLENHFD